MSNIKIGDIVARKSYGFDIMFKVVDIQEENGERVITLKGIDYRIQADAPESDLMVQAQTRGGDQKRRCNIVAERKVREALEAIHLRRSKKAMYRSTSKDNARKFQKPGRILHIDGDNDYLDTCLNKYKELGLDAVGVYIPEKDQPSSVYKLLQEHRPDILVLTGHDGMIKGQTDYQTTDNYSNSKYYIEAVKEARRYEKNEDSLVIFAGACQSMYDGIIKAGANFASSPYRVLIHALDPLLVCQKIAYTSIEQVVVPSDVINATTQGVEGIGGIQTRGKLREGYPAEPYTL